MKNHWIAVFGGAVAGSEAAAIMADHGAEVILFEQNALPYGKIEYGLPKWHVKLRDKHERSIDEKLTHPHIHYVPLCKLGRDIDFDEICTCWGVSSILLATGAWLDRPLPVEGIDKYIGKGLYYQNPFVQWFNQKDDPKYHAENYSVDDETIIVGGGLASIDVAKIVMIEIFQKAIAKFGKSLDALSIERLGLPKAAESLGLNIEQLNIKGCSIFYRRRIIDMPLSANPQINTIENWEKTYAVRRKILAKVKEKYLFDVIECHSPIRALSNGDHLDGLVFGINRIVDGAIQPTQEEVIVKANLVISSIGSIPEPVKGLNANGEYMQPVDKASGKMKCIGNNIFVLGNAIIGKGNIKESLSNARQVSESVATEFLGLSNEDKRDEIEINTPVAGQVARIEEIIKFTPKPGFGQIKTMATTIKRLQKKAGYDGEYVNWIKKHLPLRLEDIIHEDEKNVSK